LLIRWQASGGQALLDKSCLWHWRETWYHCQSYINNQFWGLNSEKMKDFFIQIISNFYKISTVKQNNFPQICLQLSSLHITDQTIDQIKHDISETAEQVTITYLVKSNQWNLWWYKKIFGCKQECLKNQKFLRSNIELDFLQLFRCSVKRLKNSVKISSDTSISWVSKIF